MNDSLLFVASVLVRASGDPSTGRPERRVYALPLRASCADEAIEQARPGLDARVAADRDAPAGVEWSVEKHTAACFEKKILVKHHVRLMMHASQEGRFDFSIFITALSLELDPFGQVDWFMPFLATAGEHAERACGELLRRQGARIFASDAVRISRELYQTDLG